MSGLWRRTLERVREDFRASPPIRAFLLEPVNADWPAALDSITAFNIGWGLYLSCTQTTAPFEAAAAEAREALVGITGAPYCLGEVFERPGWCSWVDAVFLAAFNPPIGYGFSCKWWVYTQKQAAPVDAWERAKAASWGETMKDLMALKSPWPRYAMLPAVERASVALVDLLLTMNVDEPEGKRPPYRPRKVPYPDAQLPTLIADWKRAKAAGVSRDQYARDNGLTLQQFDTLQSRHAKRQKRDSEK